MARGRSSFITLNPSTFFHLISSPTSASLLSHRKALKIHRLFSPTLIFSLLSLFLSFFFLGILIAISHNSPSWLSSSQNSSPSFPSFPSFHSPLLLASLSLITSNDDEEPSLSNSVMVPLPVHAVSGNISTVEREFWHQPDGEGYKPCLDFSIEYRKESAKISKENRRFLVVVVTGGLNQQRNQIIDAVVIARILKASLVVPILQVNMIWKDESEFSEIFDVEHFKRILQTDVRVVSSLPSTLLQTKTSKTRIANNVSHRWILARFSKQLSEKGLLVLRGLDSKLSKNLPPDLQKLRCKVAFHALRFSAQIRDLGSRFARRMWIEGPYVAVHLRLEKDVWIRTGCLTGLGSDYDSLITNAHASQFHNTIDRSNMSYSQRHFSGLCPLNALEIARLLKSLGAPRYARIYGAGGVPFGGRTALKPLLSEFPNLVTKFMLEKDGELSPYMNKSSSMAAIDYIVSLSSEVFVPSHGGNMGQIMQGHRAYVGHRKYIKPNKRAMLHFFANDSISDEELSSVMRKLHRKYRGQPELREGKRDRDVVAYPVPGCMCRHKTGIF